ncbi:hypothetical protein [Acinetobacter phage AB1I1M-1]
MKIYQTTLDIKDDRGYYISAIINNTYCDVRIRINGSANSTVFTKLNDVKLYLESEGCPNSNEICAHIKAACDRNFAKEIGELE